MITELENEKVAGGAEAEGGERGENNHTNTAGRKKMAPT